MGRRSSIRFLVLVATLTVVSATVLAQNQQAAQNQQTQAQPAQNQQGQNQQQNQTQNQQQPKKKSFWDKVKDATQNGQNTVQNGQNTVQNTVQQGRGTVQQGAQQVQGVQNGAQGMVQQGAQFPSNNGATGAFSGGGGGAGSCGANCFDAGPFQANVSQMTMAQQGGWHVIRMNVQFHNSSDQPLIIAYRDGSMSMVDNNGAAYIPAGGSAGELQGMGIDRGNQTDSSFVLGPGQTGNAMFSVARGRGPTDPVGTAYAYNLTIDELQPQNGAMAIPVRQYNLNFPSLAPGSMNALSSFPSAGAGGKAGAVGGAAGGAAGNAGTNYAGSATPQRNTRGAAVQRGVSVPPQQQRMVNGRQVSTPPATNANAAATKPASAVVNNAALKSGATATPAAAAKPTPAAAKTATPPKKAATTSTTTTNTTNNK